MEYEDRGMSEILRLDNTNIYYLDAAAVSVVGALLFLLLSPGFLFKLPSKASARTATIVHAAAFLVVFGGLAMLLAFSFKTLHQQADRNRLRQLPAALLRRGEKF